MPDNATYIFDHERLNVYQVSLQFVEVSSAWCDNLAGKHRHARDQLLRASLSIVLNIAEGNGKWSPADRRRFFEIARGSATECAGCLDAMRVTQGILPEHATEGKLLLRRIVAMLTKLMEKLSDEVREVEASYGVCDSNVFDNEPERDEILEEQY